MWREFRLTRSEVYAIVGLPAGAPIARLLDYGGPQGGLEQLAIECGKRARKAAIA